MIGPGYGMEINNGKVVTALHVAMKMNYPIVYADESKDLVVIKTGHKNKYNLRFEYSERDFLFIETVPKPGESGKPYVVDGKVYGVIIGESGDYGIVTAFDNSIVHLLK